MITYWDRGGRPIDLTTATRLVCDADYRHIRRDIIRKPETSYRSGVLVKTDWIGLDAIRHPIGTPPLIFWTMIIGGPLDGQVRYSATEAGANEWHDLAVRAVKRELGILP